MTTLNIGTAARRTTIGALALLLAACSPYGPVQTITWGEMLASMVAFFIMAAAFTIFIALFVDILRRHDLAGGMKALWVLALVILPFVGSLIYIAMRPSELNAPRPYTDTPRDYPLPPADSAG